MARILYGVCGEGMGHALRSTAVIEYLKEKHEIVVLSSMRAFRHLSSLFDNVYEIHGFHLEYEDNKVKSFASFIDNTAKLPSGVLKSVRKINDIIKGFNPEICITDFEPFTCYTARRRDIPCISLDNNSTVTRTKFDYDKKFLPEYLLAQTVSNYMVPEADYYLLTTFFFPECRDQNTRLFPPIVRRDIRDLIQRADEASGEHVLVYQTSRSNHYLLTLLKYINEKFIVYGLSDSLREEDNCIFKPFGHDDFYDDFFQSKAVVTNGGFSLMSEAVCLGKPVLSVPIKNQFEQILNATYLEKLGFGAFCEKITFGEILRFLNRLPEYRRNLEKVRFGDNRNLFSGLDQLLFELCSQKSES